MLPAFLLLLAAGAPAPAPKPDDVVAVVRGTKILRKDAARGDILAQRVVFLLLTDVARERKISATDAEVDAVIKRTAGTETSGGLPPAEMREFVTRMICSIKLDQALWLQYGGRVVTGMMGPMAVGAQLRLIKDEEKKGRLTILDPALAQSFWDDLEHNSDPAMDDEAEVKRMMTTPWYLDPHKE